jgi:hypothetical protein
MAPVVGPRGSGADPKGGNMTAELAGKTALDGVWVTLNKLKRQWVLLVFFIGALFGARET